MSYQTVYLILSYGGRTNFRIVGLGKSMYII